MRYWRIVEVNANGAYMSPRYIQNEDVPADEYTVEVREVSAVEYFVSESISV